MSFKKYQQHLLICVTLAVLDFFTLIQSEEYIHTLTLNHHTTGIKAVAFSHNNLLASAGFDKTIILWDAQLGTYIRTLKGHTLGVTSVAFCSKNGLASGSFDKTAIVWDPETGNIKHTLKGHTGYVVAVAFSPKSVQIFNLDRVLATGSYDHNIILWNPEDGSLLTT